jgi:glycosyltransferase involved in cell wall biosynthesis
MLHLLVLSNDPISEYVAKGEIKPRYFNPGNLFDRVTVITPADSDVAPVDVQTLAGDAQLDIVPVGHFRPKRPWRYFSYRNRIRAIAVRAAPDVIRSYNPGLFGTLAIDAAKISGARSVISIHSNYDHDSRTLKRQNGEWQTFAWQTFSRFVYERKSLRRADVVVAAYRYAAAYVQKVSGRPASEIIYNRVYGSGVPAARESLHTGAPLRVISVGNLDYRKGHDRLIRSLALVDGVHLTIVGGGPDLKQLGLLAAEMGVSGRVEFTGPVANMEIPSRYRAADVFAWPSRFGGLSIPVIEAGSVGLPLVLGIVRDDPDPGDIFGDCAALVESTPEGFAAEFRSLVASPERLAELSRGSYRVFQSINGDMMEEREKRMYLRLMSSQKS